VSAKPASLEELGAAMILTSALLCIIAIHALRATTLLGLLLALATTVTMETVLAAPMPTNVFCKPTIALQTPLVEILFPHLPALAIWDTLATVSPALK
jgi:hypothetical protein